MATKKSKPAPAPKSSRKRNADDASLEKMLRQFDRQEAQLDGKNVDAIESHFRQSSPDSQYRRIGLMFLTKSGKQLVELAESDREAGEMFADVAEGIERAAKRHRLAAETLEASANRVRLAMCGREDMQELLDAAKAWHDGDSEAANG